MQRDYWHKQSPDETLFPELEWARPENKLHAGKLLIIGGNLHGFSAPATAYGEAQKAGIGTTRVLLPNKIQKIVGGFLPEAEFAPSTPSGSFASASLASWLEQAAWADGVLLAGDLGRNSETAIVLEKFLEKTTTPVTITKDALDYLLSTKLLDRPDTMIVGSTGQIQKLATSVGTTQPLTSGMDLLRMIDALHELSTKHPATIVTNHLDTLIVAQNGQISTTKSPDDPVWRVKTASHAAVWWLQHLQKPFEAVTSSLRFVFN
jgi:NAD(P)H-hydrate repair Nnr-like enzyme with NAD(P)H-hydrate dehydratase domain